MQRSREEAGESWYQQAEAAYRRALQLKPEEVGALVGMAWVCNSRHEFGEGRRWARLALKADSQAAEAYALLGDADVECGDYDRAFEHYQACLNIRPGLSSYSRAAHLLWLTGDAPRAQALMQRAIAAGAPRAEDTAWCRVELAKMCFDAGDLASAEGQAHRALKAMPHDHRALSVMGRVKTARRDYEAAIEYYRLANKTAAHHDALVALGDLYVLTGRHDEAEQQYRSVLALHRPSGVAHSHDGLLHHHPHGHGNIELARFCADHDRHLDEALAEAEAAYQTCKNVFAADTLAWCCYKKGAYQRARQLISQALRWNTPDAGILFHAGMIHAKLGENESAKKYLDQALKLNPHFHPQYAAQAADMLKTLSDY
jgi:tetratricopeptide (TPR) repeat protein